LKSVPEAPQVPQIPIQTAPSLVNVPNFLPLHTYLPCTILPTSNQRSILLTYLPWTIFYLGNCFLGFYETGKFKELYKIEEEVIGERGRSGGDLEADF
jgi:hypothetical protein